MRKELAALVPMIFLGFLLLGIATIKFNSTPLVYQISYFCCGGLFGVGISLLSFKAESLRRLSPEMVVKEFVKLVLIFVITLGPVYVIPLYFLYSMDDGFKLLLLYITGILLIGGTAALILTLQKRDIPEPTSELRVISKFFIIIVTSFALLVSGSMLIFYSTNLVTLGAILIFVSLISFIYSFIYGKKRLLCIHEDKNYKFNYFTACCNLLGRINLRLLFS